MKYDLEIKLPDNFDKVLEDSSIIKFYHDWDDLIKKESLKAKKELRLKKINEINAKNK